MLYDKIFRCLLINIFIFFGKFCKNNTLKMKQKKHLSVNHSFTLLIFMAIVGLMPSCNENSPGNEEILPTPKIIQGEEISDNPLSLNFSWEAVENARKYNYQLVDARENIIAQGSTGDLNIEFVHEENASLRYGVQYTFSLQALPAANNWKASEFAETKVTTSNSELDLSLEAVNYRTIRFRVIPKDKSMYYDLGSTNLARYTKHSSDMDFIKDMGFGYFQKLASITGVPWAEVMKQGMHQGKYEDGENRRLRPGSEFVAFAYGVRFKEDVNAEDPVEVITPLVIKSVKSPEWEATNNATFEIGEFKASRGEDGKLSLTVEIIPSDTETRYFVIFYEEESLLSYESVLDMACSIIESIEDRYKIMNNGEELNWARTDWLYDGKQTASTTPLWGTWNINYGQPFGVLVFGVDKDGLVTTNIAQKSHKGFAEQDVE